MLKNRYIKIFVVIALFVCAFILSTKNGISLHADIANEQNDKLTIKGVQLKYDQEYTEDSIGENAFRFVANFDDYNVPAGYTAQYGIIMAWGNAEANSDFEKGKTLNAKYVNGFCGGLDKDNDFRLTIKEMPLDGASEYQNITARAYVELTSTSDSSKIYVYGSTVRTINFVELCRKVFNIDNHAQNDEINDEPNVCNFIANENRVKKTTSAGVVSYGADITRDSSDLNKIYIDENDTIELIVGDYSYLDIEDEEVDIMELPSGVKIFGPNKNTALDLTDRVYDDPDFEAPDFSEACVYFAFSIGNGLSNIEIAGLDFEGDVSLILCGSQGSTTGEFDGVNFHNNICVYTVESAITDREYGLDGFDGDIHNLIIENNFFCNYDSINTDVTINTTVSSDISLQGVSGRVLIANNTFYSTALSLIETKVSENTYYNESVIRLDRLTTDSLIFIEGNSFNHLGAAYQIIIGELTDSAKKCSVDISDNDFSINEEMIQGNGIAIFNVGDNSNIKICNNYNFNITAYMNSITISSVDVIPTGSYTKSKFAITITGNDFASECFGSVPETNAIIVNRYKKAVEKVENEERNLVGIYCTDDSTKYIQGDVTLKAYASMSSLRAI